MPMTLPVRCLADPSPEQQHNITSHISFRRDNDYGFISMRHVRYGGRIEWKLEAEALYIESVKLCNIEDIIESY